MTTAGTLTGTSMTALPAALMPATLFLTLDLMGTFVFAISGAAAGVKSRLDVFGVSVLAFAAENAGGVTRDVLLGSVPRLHGVAPPPADTAHTVGGSLRQRSDELDPPRDLPVALPVRPLARNGRVGHGWLDVAGGVGRPRRNAVFAG